MQFKKLFLLTALANCIVGCFAQVTFEKSIGTTQLDYALDLTRTSDNGFFLVGLTEDINVTPNFGFNTNVYLIKTDSLGNRLWSIGYGFDTSYVTNELGTYIINNYDSTYIIAGIIFGSSTVSNDAAFILIKIDEYGNVLNYKVISNYMNYTNIHNVYTLPDSSYIMAASLGPPGPLGAAIIRFDKDLNINSAKILHIDSLIGINTIMYDNGYYYMGGNCALHDSVVSLDRDAILIKVDTAYANSYVKIYNTPRMSSVNLIYKNPVSGTYLVNFSSRYEPLTPHKTVFLKMDTMLNLYDTICSTATTNGFLPHLRNLPDGNYLVEGLINSDITKIDTSGNILWSRGFQIGGSGYVGNSIVNNDGTITTVGMDGNYVQQYFDAYFFQTDLNGYVGCPHYNYGIGLDTFKVTSQTYTGLQISDWVYQALSMPLVTYSKIDSVIDWCSSAVNYPTVENTFSIKVYPNPAEKFIRITNCKNANLNIFDLSGQSMSPLITTTTIGEDFQVDIRKLKSGFYILEIKDYKGIISHVKIYKI